jgi:hypothetical protein
MSTQSSRNNALRSCSKADVTDERPSVRLGYATEIGRGQLQYGFATAGCRRLLAQVSPDNHGSTAAFKTIGMEFHSTAQNEERGVRQVYVVDYRSEFLGMPSRQRS